jgi:effector-binding domain-containing protein
MKKIIYSLFATALLVSCGETETETTEENASHEEATTETTTTETTETVALPAGWEETTTDQIVYLAIMDSVTNEEMHNLGDRLGERYGKIVGYMTAEGIDFAGMPLTHWFSWDTTALSVYAAGIPVAEGTVPGEGMEVITIPASAAFKYSHVGPYEGMQEPHFAINEYIYGNGVNVTGGPWEIYVTDPGTEPDSTKWVTEIWYPIGE